MLPEQCRKCSVFGRLDYVAGLYENDKFGQPTDANLSTAADYRRARIKLLQLVSDDDCPGTIRGTSTGSRAWDVGNFIKNIRSCQNPNFEKVQDDPLIGKQLTEYWIPVAAISDDLGE